MTRPEIHCPLSGQNCKFVECMLWDKAACGIVKLIRDVRDIKNKME